MQVSDFAYLFLFIAIVVLATPPLGMLLTRALQGQPPKLLGWLKPIERLIYRLSGVNPDEEMTWKTYAVNLVIFTLVGGILTLVLELLQAHLPFNPAGMAAVPMGIAVNTAISFIANTNWP